MTLHSLAPTSPYQLLHVAMTNSLRYGMLSPDKSSTHFKAIRLQCTLFALTARRTFSVSGSLGSILVSQSCTSNYFIFIICLWISTTLAPLQYIFSTAINANMKVWVYDSSGPRVDQDQDAPRLLTTMLFSADGTRLFCCGPSLDGDQLVEWDAPEGAIKRTYNGFRKGSSAIVQFDTTRNQFLAAGDDFLVKFWDMDNTNILTTTDCEGGLPESPWLRFNREGSLLAVTANDNGIKILANTDGQRLLRLEAFVEHNLGS